MVKKNNLRDQFNAYGFDADRMMFSASCILTLFFGLCLVWKPILWALFAILGVVSIWKGYLLFGKRKLKFKPLKELNK